MGSSVMEDKDEAYTEHLYCCGAVTEVLKFGTRNLHSGNQPKVLFLIIPGNPGVVGFYKTFMQTLHQTLGMRYPVWAVSHAGHCVPPDTMDMIEDPTVMAAGDVFGLNGQIEHKLAFLTEHVPRDSRLVLVGHSIGCYLILEMMKRDPELQVVKSVMLFPTIERMAATPQGRVMTPVLCRLRYVAYLPIFLLSLLPDVLKTFMVKLVFRGLRSLDHSTVPPTVSLINVDTAANAMYMGSQEMLEVLERDNFTINQNLDKGGVELLRTLGPMQWNTYKLHLCFTMEPVTTGALCSIIRRSRGSFQRETSDCVVEEFVMPSSWTQERKWLV
uniref:lipid droplet-associated hydrolase isoform X1 n=1 Tax=Oncorhynchus gorbuscha TaxID=8017 RepID=UPI001EAEC3C8|nr:lipid droplet-associated hydrolase isoform X1 [Oncorhynchus gorbuscha]